MWEDEEREVRGTRGGSGGGQGPQQEWWQRVWHTNEEDEGKSSFSEVEDNDWEFDDEPSFEDEFKDDDIPPR